MTDTIQVSLSTAFEGKALKPDIDKDAYAKSFQAQRVTVAKLIEHILSGGAWAVGTYKGDYRKKENFIQSQVLALDLDSLKTDTAVNSEIAALIHCTPSSTADTPKKRMIFILDTPITDSDEWETLQRSCLYQYRHLDPDTSAKDCARFFFGAGQGDSAQHPERRVTEKIRKAWLASYDLHVKTQLELTKDDAPTAPTLTGTPLEKFAEKRLELVVGDVRSSTPHVDRNQWLFRGTCRAYGMVLGSWPGMTQPRVLGEMRMAGRAIGLPESEIERTIQSAVERADALPLPTDTTGTYTPLKEWDAPAMPTVQQNGHGTVHSQERPLLVSGVDAADASQGRYSQRLGNPQWVIGMQSHLSRLDMLIGGWSPGNLHTFLGETGSGKSTIMASLAYAFIGQGKGLIVSCENSPSLFVDRLIAYVLGQVLERPLTYAEINRACRMDWKAVGGMGKREKPEITPFTSFERAKIHDCRVKIKSNLAGNDVQFTSPGNLSVAQLEAAVYQCHEGLKWVLIDSLNNIVSGQTSMYDRLTQAAITSRGIAQTYDVPVICTAQIGRSTKNRANKRIRVSDARDSGAIEEQSQRLLSVFNPYHLQTIGEIEDTVNVEHEYGVKEGQVSIDLLKNNDGDVGRSCHVRYIGGAGFYEAK